MNSPLVKAQNALEELRKCLPRRGRIFIVPHDHPDPDSLAAAAAMHLLLQKHFKRQSQIVFSGLVSRAENRALLKSFKYKWRFTSDVKKTTIRAASIYVDTSPWSGNVTTPQGSRPIAVIDHHPTSRKALLPPKLFCDVQAGAGATVTMVYGYLTAAQVPIPKWLATVMCYAIASETMDLSRDISDADLTAYSALLLQSNLKLLGQIRHAPLPRVYFAHVQEAIARAKMYGRVAWTHIETVEQPEIIAEVADLLLRMERITWTFCTAYFRERLIISFRSSLPRARCGYTLKQRIGKNGSAGGHSNMAAGYMSLKGLDRTQMEERREELVKGLLYKIDPRLKRQSEPLGLLVQPVVEKSEGA